MHKVTQSFPAVKAMVVDDQDPIRKAMKRILHQLGITKVVECFDGDEAILEINRQPDIELVLCDIYMRKVDGFQVLTHMRNRTVGSDIPFIIVTGEANKDDIVKASDLGADDYVIKPFQAEAMIAKIQQVLSQFHSPPPLLKALRAGDRLLLSKRHEDALKVYESALNLDPRSVRAKHSIAVALDLCGRVEEALGRLMENIDASPSYYKNYATIANINIRLGQGAAAITAIKKELEFNPKQPTRQVQLAKLLIKEGDAHDAINHFREALKENSRNRAALMGIGQAFAQIDDLDKAIYYFKRHRRHFPTDPRPLSAIIKFCLQAGEAKKAELALRDEKQLHPERHDTYVYLARFYASSGNHDGALAVLKDLFEIAPGHPEGLMVRGKLEMKTSRFAEAVLTFEAVNKVAPSVESYLAQAECMQQTKEFKASIDILHQVLLLAPQHANAFYLLANAYKKTMQYAKATLVYLAAKKAGADPQKCAKNIKLCWAQTKQRRVANLKASA